MKLTRFGWSVLLSVGIVSSALAGESEEGGTDNQYPTLAPQTRCPVMGGKIDSSYYTDIQGQRIYHCCSGCSEKLTADPDTYFKKAAAEGVLFANVQTKCPVNGRRINKSIYTDYEGRRVFFASEKCAAKFAKEPSKYLAKLDKQTPKHDEEEHEVDHDSHQSGHSGHSGGGGCGGI